MHTQKEAEWTVALSHYTEKSSFVSAFAFTFIVLMSYLHAQEVKGHGLGLRDMHRNLLH